MPGLLRRGWRLGASALGLRPPLTVCCPIAAAAEFRLAVRWALAYKWKHWPGSRANAGWAPRPLCNLRCDDFIRRGEAIQRKARFGGTVAQKELFPAAGRKTAETPSSRSRFLNPGRKGSRQTRKSLNPKALASHLQSMRPDSRPSHAVPTSGGQASTPLGLGFSYSPAEKTAPADKGTLFTVSQVLELDRLGWPRPCPVAPSPRWREKSAESGWHREGQLVPANREFWEDAQCPSEPSRGPAGSCSRPWKAGLVAEPVAEPSLFGSRSLQRTAFKVSAARSRA